MICSVPDCQDHYGCRLRAKGLQVTPAASATARSSGPYKLRPMEQPAWEKGIAGSHRPDGSFMPVLNADGAPMSIKEASTKRRQIDDARRGILSTS